MQLTEKEKPTEKEKISARDDPVRRRGGRPAAGTDPHKRQQIIDGARRVFTSTGFDAASMSDIARAADVSKATLYVYFTSKEQLFADICAERRDRNISELIGLLDRTRPIADVLGEFASEALKRLLVPEVLRSHRIVIGVAERMPEIGRELYQSGPERLHAELAAYMAFHARAGHLHLAETDIRLAAGQFLELSQATVFRPRIYAAAMPEVGAEEIERIVSSAVRMFMAAYGAAYGTHRQQEA